VKISEFICQAAKDPNEMFALGFKAGKKALGSGSVYDFEKEREYVKSLKTSFAQALSRQPAKTNKAFKDGFTAGFFDEIERRFHPPEMQRHLSDIQEKWRSQLKGLSRASSVRAKSNAAKRSGSRRVRTAQHRDPEKVATALQKGAKGLYNARGTGGFRDAWSWLGEMLNDATGFSGSGFYHDKKLTELKDRLYKLDFEMGQAASSMEAAALQIKKQHKANQAKK